MAQMTDKTFGAYSTVALQLALAAIRSFESGARVRVEDVDPRRKIG